MPFKTEFVSICIYMIIFLSVVGVDKEETSQAKGKRRIVDLRFGNVRAKAESLRIHYQEEDQGNFLTLDRFSISASITPPIEMSGIIMASL